MNRNDARRISRNLCVTALRRDHHIPRSLTVSQVHRSRDTPVPGLRAGVGTELSDVRDHMTFSYLVTA
jgi:hypothetical protein